MQGDLEVVVAGGPGVGADGKPYGIARNNLVDMNAVSWDAAQGLVGASAQRWGPWGPCRPGICMQARASRLPTTSLKLGPGAICLPSPLPMLP